MISYLSMSIISAQIITFQQLKETQTKTFWFKLPFGCQNLIAADSPQNPWFREGFFSLRGQLDKVEYTKYSSQNWSKVSHIQVVLSSRKEINLQRSHIFPRLHGAVRYGLKWQVISSNVMCPMCLSLGLPCKIILPPICAWPLEYGYLLRIPPMIIDGTGSSDTVPKTSTSNIPPPHLIRMNCQR